MNNLADNLREVRANLLALKRHPYPYHHAQVKGWAEAALAALPDPEAVADLEREDLDRPYKAEQHRDDLTAALEDVVTFLEVEAWKQGNLTVVAMILRLHALKRVEEKP